MSNKDLLDKRDKTLEQRPLNQSVGKQRKSLTLGNVGDTPDYHERYVGANSTLTGVFKILIILLLTFSIMKVALGERVIFSTQSFLEVLRTCPKIDFSWIKNFTDWTDTLSSIWIIGDMLALSGRILSVLFFMATGCVNIIVMINHFAIYLL